MSSGKQKWPAAIIGSQVSGRPIAKPHHQYVFWFGTFEVNEIPDKNITDFISSFAKHCSSGGIGKKKAVEIVLEILWTGSELGLVEDLYDWAKTGFLAIKMEFYEGRDIISYIDYVLTCEIKKDFVYFWRLQHIGTSDLDTACIICFRNANMEHPLLKLKMCIKCEAFHAMNSFSFDSTDGKSMTCALCALPGSLVKCSKLGCPRCFCCSCIYLFEGMMFLENIKKAAEWNCFICENQGKEVIRSREKPLKEKQKIRVLSLFDGISSGKVSLDQLGFEIEIYYAAEIFQHAITVAKTWHQESIIHLGDILKLQKEKLKSLGRIDLVLGGSPCDDLSRTNPNRKGVYDMQGSGFFVFEFARVYKELKKLLHPHPVFFLFENVVVENKTKDIISSHLEEFKPVLIDAKYVSAMQRPRLFWGNIPGMHTFQDYISDNNCGQDIILQNYLTKGLRRIAQVPKLKTLTTNRSSMMMPCASVKMDDNDSFPFITELERIFGFPEHYTDCGNLGIVDRRNLLAKGWSVTVIKNLLRPLREFFICKEEI